MATQVRIHGHVQGVWFRAWTQKAARAHKLDGWVRNTADGCVEALFDGDVDSLQAMLKACHQGPPNATVTAVEVINTADVAQMSTGAGFFILDDA